MPGALLLFGCGKLIQVCFSGRMKFLWMDEYLADILLMASLLGSGRLIYYFWKRHNQNTVLVVESVSKLNVNSF